MRRTSVLQHTSSGFKPHASWQCFDCSFLVKTFGICSQLLTPIRFQEKCYLEWFVVSGFEFHFWDPIKDIRYGVGWRFTPLTVSTMIWVTFERNETFSRPQSSQKKFLNFSNRSINNEITVPNHSTLLFFRKGESLRIHRAHKFEFESRDVFWKIPLF